MSNIQVKNVPTQLHHKLRRYAKRRGRTIRDLVLEAVEREVSREEFRARLLKREPVELARSAGTSLEEVRAEREKDLNR